MIGKNLRKIIWRLLLIFCILKKKKYVSKINLNFEKEGLYYLAVKKLSALLRGATSKYNGDFCCLNCLHSLRTKDKLKSHEKYLKIKISV